MAAGLAAQAAARQALGGVGVPAVLAGLVYWGLWQFSSVLAFVWVVCVLYVTLGFRQFSHHFSEIRQALEEGNDLAARE